jgi:hypothetical protein
MATVNIPDATYLRLKERAQAMQVPLETFLERVAAGANQEAAVAMDVACPGTPEWTKAFEAWIAVHPARPFVADDSRDAIYGDERD